MPGDVESLERQLDAGNVALAKRFFFAGLFCLPWLWAANLCFFRDALCSSRTSVQLKHWLRCSAAGLAIMTLVFAAWVTVVQLGWETLGLRSILITTPDSGAVWWLDNS